MFRWFTGSLAICLWVSLIALLLARQAEPYPSLATIQETSTHTSITRYTWRGELEIPFTKPAENIFRTQIFNEWIYYLDVQWGTQTSTIYRRHYLTNERQQLNPSTNRLNDLLSWSPNNTWILYVTGSTHQLELYAMQPDGSTHHKIASQTVSNFSLQELYNPNNLWLFNVLGWQTNDTFWQVNEQSQLQAYTLSDTGFTTNHLYDLTAYHNIQLIAWSPQQDMALLRMSDQFQTPAYYLFDTPTARLIPLPTEIRHADFELWGQWLYFVDYLTPERPIYRINAEEFKTLTPSNFESELQESIDGQSLIYRGRDGNRWQIDIDGGNRTRITDNPIDGVMFYDSDGWQYYMQNNSVSKRVIRFDPLTYQSETIYTAPSFFALNTITLNNLYIFQNTPPPNNRNELIRVNLAPNQSAQPLALARNMAVIGELPPLSLPFQEFYIAAVASLLTLLSLWQFNQAHTP